MARMHSRKRGKSGSTKPASRENPSWVSFNAEEITEAIVNLANAGHSPSEIGIILRDQYGVPDVKAATEKTVQQILREQNLLDEIPEDLMNLVRKSVKLKSHMGENNKDYSAKRGHQLTVSKIRRLVKYYKSKKRLPADWRYTEETAELLAK